VSGPLFCKPVLSADFFLGGEGAGREGAATSDTAALLQTTAVICQDYSHNPSHWNADKTLSQVRDTLPSQYIYIYHPNTSKSVALSSF
jgi:hypothetical protein